MRPMVGGFHISITMILAWNFFFFYFAISIREKQVQTTRKSFLTTSQMSGHRFQFTQEKYYFPAKIRKNIKYKEADGSKKI